MLVFVYAEREGFAYKSSLVSHSVGSQAAPRGSDCCRNIAAVFESLQEPSSWLFPSPHTK